MADQMQLYDASENQTHADADRAKRKWENGFQRWSNQQFAANEHKYSLFGYCGFGSMCDYCEDNTYGRPCVRALNNMLREKHLKIDYETADYEKVWEGILGDG